MKCKRKKVVLKFKSLVRITEPVNGYDLSLLSIQHPNKTGCKSTLFFCAILKNLEQKNDTAKLRFTKKVIPLQLI